MRARRPNGTGSLYQRDDGYWVVAVSVGDQRIVKYRRTQKAAQELLSQLLVSQQRRSLIKTTGLTLDAWIEQWFDLNQPRLRPSTLQTYRQVLTPISTTIGTTKLDTLTPLLLTQAFLKLQREGIGQRRVQLAHTYLKTCLSQAVDLDLIAANPMERVKKPHWKPKERQYWSVAEADRFITTCLESPAKWGPLFAFLTTTGLRISEALGLTWADVDWHKRQVRIRQALVWSKESFRILPPKTPAGRRHVSLTESALAALQQLPRPMDQHMPIFRTSNDTPPRPDHLRPYLITRCDQAGVPRLHLHGLRHVAAMLALEAVGDAYLVQQRLGHSHVTVTLGIYGYPARKEAVIASAVDELLKST
ncbi:tyrosine-type recombinase/integrase [Nitrolancea hollandica]|uniref:Putative Phage integrase n=1 Tax=Nitrolancea hollandica Lb TaxID=1129897 RepID=I4ELC2_9BACT|nr:site-specific integrase [Nitrolancea hollandica]CCF85484.1 putative Phage integrase [Nitrolancea hollandica Lb]